LSASKGFARAQLELGMRLLSGREKTAQPHEVLHWLKLAAAQPGPLQADAEFQLGRALFGLVEGKRDDAAGLVLFKQAAERGHTGAARAVAKCMAEGLGGCKEDAAGTVHWWKRAAQDGDATAMHLLADSLSTGYGCVVDQKQAAHWRRQAADQGLTEAMTAFALCLLNGEGVERDGAAGLALLRQTAERGDPKGMTMLALSLLRGDGPGGAANGGEAPVAEKEEALRWYERAAAEGDGQALCNLGHLYERGDADLQLAPDSARAFGLYRGGAEVGHLQSMTNVGGSLLQGTGCVQDEARGFEWLQRSARAGHPHGMCARNRLFGR
jgi:uncharacterized protein